MNKLHRFWLEVSFFVFYFIILQFLTDLQYILAYDNESLASATWQRITTTPLFALAYYFYYRKQLPFLFSKKYLRFAGSIGLFLLFLECFLHVIDWWSSINPFVTEKARESGRQIFLNPPFPRQMIALTVTNLLILTGLGYFVKKTEDEIKLRTLNEQHIQLQLDYLKAQLHPHFFFNTLNNIYSLALDASLKTAPTVAKLADLMRYIIYEGNKGMVPLSKEIEFLCNYIELEKIRHTNAERIEFSHRGNLNGRLIEPLLFIPLVENGFKHGMSQTLEQGWLHILLHMDQNRLCFQVSNAKHKQKQPCCGGLGLQNIQKRLELLYPGRHVLQVHENESIYHVRLELNLLS